MTRRPFTEFLYRLLLVAYPSDFRRTPGGGAAGGVGRVGGGAGLAGGTVGKLGGHRLAPDHRAGVAQRPDALGVLGGAAPGMAGKSVFGRHVDGVDDVLDADRNAVEGADGAAFRLPGIGGAGLGQREVGVEEDPGLHLRLAGGDAGEAGGDEGLGGERTGGDPAGGLGGAEIGRVSHWLRLGSPPSSGRNRRAA